MRNEKKFRKNLEARVDLLESEIFKQECAKMLSDESYDKDKLDKLKEERATIRYYLEH